jgi:hypothetical protein
MSQSNTYLTFGYYQPAAGLSLPTDCDHFYKRFQPLTYWGAVREMIADCAFKLGCKRFLQRPPSRWCKKCHNTGRDPIPLSEFE